MGSSPTAGTQKRVRRRREQVLAPYCFGVACRVLGGLFTGGEMTSAILQAACKLINMVLEVVRMFRIALDGNTETRYKAAGQHPLFDVRANSSSA